MGSIVYLAVSILVAGFTYSVLYLIMPMILGTFYSVFDSMSITNQAWIDTYNTNEESTRFLVSLMPTLGIFLLVLKVLMAASARGSD